MLILGAVYAEGNVFILLRKISESQTLNAQTNVILVALPSCLDLLHLFCEI